MKRAVAFSNLLAPAARTTVMALVFFAGAALGSLPSAAHDALARKMLMEGDSSRSDWFLSLKSNGGVPCCDDRDCRRVDAEWRRTTDTWWIYVNGFWRPVPNEVVLKSPKSIDGEAYACMGEDSFGDVRHAMSGLKGPLPGQIYCFVPPDLGS